LRQLREENAKLKRLVADLSLDQEWLQDVLKKFIKPSRKRSLADELIQRIGARFCRACASLGRSRSVCYYQSVAQDQTLLAMRIKEITEVRIRYGYRRVHVLLQREGWHITHKRVYRLYSWQAGAA
jgi:putative transposase